MAQALRTRLAWSIYLRGSVLILLGYNFKKMGDRNDSVFLEGGSTMVLEPVECPVCGGINVIKHGKSGEGKQRYLCHSILKFLVLDRWHEAG
jgi:hypothetical protein